MHLSGDFSAHASFPGASRSHEEKKELPKPHPVVATTTKAAKAKLPGLGEPPHNPARQVYGNPRQASTQPEYFEQFKDACDKQAEGAALCLIKLLKTKPGIDLSLYDLAMKANFPSVIRFLVKRDHANLDQQMFQALYAWAQEKEHAGLKHYLLWLKFNRHSFELTPLMTLCNQAREIKTAKNEIKTQATFIQELIDSGSDPWEMVEGGLTALFVATAHELPDVIQILLNCPLPKGSAQEFFQVTLRAPYEIALEIGNPEILRLFEAFANKHALSLKELLAQPIQEGEIPSLFYLPFEMDPFVKQVEEVDKEMEAMDRWLEQRAKEMAEKPKPSPASISSLPSDAILRFTPVVAVVPIPTQGITQPTMTGTFDDDIQMAIRMGNVPLVESFLLSISLSSEQKIAALTTYDLNPLALAAEYKQERIALALMAFYRANKIPVTQLELYTFLKMVIAQGLNDVLEHYLTMTKFGGIKKADLRSLQDPEGYTLLNMACEVGNIDTARLLLTDGSMNSLFLHTEAIRFFTSLLEKSYGRC